MTIADRWLLPDGIEEILPPDAQVHEQLRRQLLDLYRSWGYELVMPPFIEYLESLLIGAGHDLDLKTFKVTDQLTGRMMGIRADITPQVARIDAHALRRNGPVRLCYAGSVLHTRTDQPFDSRGPIQVGAELYGHAGIDSDLEVIALMLEGLMKIGLTDLSLDLGHVAIYRTLAESSQLAPAIQQELFELMQAKACTEIDQLLDRQPVPAPLLRELPHLHGEPGLVLPRSRQLLAATPAPVQQALDDLEQVVRRIGRLYPSVALYCDLSELRGYHYHTGLVFAAYTSDHGREVAKGGRYDRIGEAFGRARPATGFSTDLKSLFELRRPADPVPGAIFVPQPSDEPAHRAVIDQLRAAGERVISALPGDSGSVGDLGCDRQLLFSAGGQWRLVEL